MPTTARTSSAELPIIFSTARDSAHRCRAGSAARRRRLPDEGYEPPAPERARERAVPPASRRLRKPKRGQADPAPRAADARRRAHAGAVGTARSSCSRSPSSGSSMRSRRTRPREESPAAQLDAANVVLDDNTITSHIKRIRRKFQVYEPKFDGIQDGLTAWATDGWNRPCAPARTDVDVAQTPAAAAEPADAGLPWAGYQYVLEVESVLRKAESEARCRRWRRRSPPRSGGAKTFCTEADGRAAAATRAL